MRTILNSGGIGVLKLLSRRKASTAPDFDSVSGSSVGLSASETLAPAIPPAPDMPAPIGVVAEAAVPAGAKCPLSAISAGSRATVLEVRCGDMDACRLRALGICEGACVSVVRSRDCTLLEVRGARLAVGSAIAAGIVVMPLA